MRSKAFEKFAEHLVSDVARVISKTDETFHIAFEHHHLSRWHPASTAPYNQDLELRVAEDVVEDSCRRGGRGWCELGGHGGGDSLVVRRGGPRAHAHLPCARSTLSPKHRECGRARTSRPNHWHEACTRRKQFVAKTLSRQHSVRETDFLHWEGAKRLLI